MEFEDGTSWDYKGQDPTTKERAELRINEETLEFLLPRRKNLKKYTVVFDAKWPEIVSYDCSNVYVCNKDQTWPIDEPLPPGLKIQGEAAIYFAFLRAREKSFFQIWTLIPQEDVNEVIRLTKNYLGRPPVPGLAHHGTAAAVRYVIERCTVVEKIQLAWHDWIKKGPSTKPRKSAREKAPILVLCKEGIAYDFYGAAPTLEQMSTFWPWRYIREILPLNETVPEILFVWHEDSYTFRQQIWDNSMRDEILAKIRTVHEDYLNDDSTKEVRLIRPWSFPSRFHETWDFLQPFSSKASREGFPPIYENRFFDKFFKNKQK